MLQSAVNCFNCTILSHLHKQILYEQFKFFLNLYFLIVALTQFIPQLRIGYIYTYWAPLVSVCVLCVHVCSWERSYVYQRSCVSLCVHVLHIIIYAAAVLCTCCDHVEGVLR